MAVAVEKESRTILNEGIRKTDDERKRFLKAYIPEDLDLIQLLTDHKIKDLMDDKHLDRMYHFIHTLYFHKITRKTRWHGCNLKYDYLEKIYTRNFLKYKKALIACGVISCNEHYVIGKYSKNYRLTDEYLEKPFRAISVEDSILLKNVRNWTQNSLPTTKIHEHLYNFLSELEVVEGADLTEVKPECVIIAEMIKDRNFYLYQDDYGRVHTNITILNKKIRTHLRWKGESLVSIDIKNSQPLFLNVVIDEYFNKFPLERQKMAVAKDVLKYRELTEKGRFYEYCMKKFGVSFEKRNQFKKWLFKNVFYGKVLSVKFRKFFPNVSKIIEYYKKQNYKRLSHAMQRAESSLVIGKICGRIMNEQPDVFIATIHDSVLTTRENVDYVIGVMKREFGNICLIPQLSVEDFNEEIKEDPPEENNQEIKESKEVVPMADSFNIILNVCLLVQRVYFGLILEIFGFT